jgi:hypothetical protein
MECKELSTKQKVRYLKKSGMNIPEICRSLNLGKGTVGYHLKNTEEILQNKYKRDFTDNIVANILDFYKTNNGNLHLTSLKFNEFSKWTLRNLLEKEGLYGNFTKINDSRNKSLAVINWKKEKKEILIGYKGGKCEFCGYSKCNNALEFHHKDPTKKDFNISSHSYSFDRMKLEADKCLLLCANCHREEHFRLKEITKINKK